MRGSLWSIMLAMLLCLMASTALAPGALGQDQPSSNLRFDKIRYSQTTLMKNEPVDIELSVNNSGDVRLTYVMAYFYVREPGQSAWNDPTDIVRIDRLPANNITMVVLHWTPKMEGSYGFKFEIDPDNKINETNEDDNVMSDKLVVRSGHGDSGCFGAIGTSVGLLLCVTIPWQCLRRPGPWDRGKLF